MCRQFRVHVQRRQIKQLFPCVWLVQSTFSSIPFQVCGWPSTPSPPFEHSTRFKKKSTSWSKPARSPTTTQGAEPHGSLASVMVDVQHSFAVRPALEPHPEPPHVPQAACEEEGERPRQQGSRSIVSAARIITGARRKLSGWTPA